MKVITAEMLMEYRPCKFQLEKFEKLFPRGANLTLKNIRICVENKLDIHWFTWTFLHGQSIDLYDDQTCRFKPNCSFGRNRMKSKLFREFLQHCVRPLWEAIKLDRESK